MRNLLFVIAGLTLVLVSCDRRQPPAPETQAAEPAASASPAAPAEQARHSASLAPTQGNKASGALEFASQGDSVAVTGTINGLEPGSTHGFHVHEKGDCSAPDASSAGGHFNPTSQPHGNPDAPPHHGGDLQNISADAQGVAQVNLQLSGVTLGSGAPDDIVGKAVVVHEKADDYKSQPAGNSGARISCGVIE